MQFMDTDIRFATVNGINAEHGCYIDGVHGQYAPDMIYDVARAFGIDALVYGSTPAEFRRQAESTTGEAQERAWDDYHDCVNHIEWILNQHTTNGVWAWQEGNLFLLEPTDDDTF